MNTNNSRPVSLYILTALMLFQGLSGIYGGGALVLDPSGELLGLPIGLLEGTPFDTYLIPGIILFLVLGIVPLIIVYGLVRRTGWALVGAALVSVALVIWIGVEIAMIGYDSDPPLQLIYGSVGIALLILSQLPSIQGFFNSKQVTDHAIN